MKFLCIECDRIMEFAERQLPGDGTMAAVFTCGACGREVAMLANPMETQLVSSLGVVVGGRTVPEQPLELTRSRLATGGAGAFAEEPPADVGSSPRPVEWSDDALARLERVPSFVRGMVKRIYTDWAREHDVAALTPEVMDRARRDLGLEGM
ncbi:MAG: PCP reductase family protein [Longimicrobiales bacterium]